jgi:hypothetical protein
MLNCLEEAMEAAKYMSRKHKETLASAVLFATVLVISSPSSWADGNRTQSAKSEPTPINLAGLAAVLRAASERKQSGSEVTLKKDTYLRGRPTNDAGESNMLPAGTVVRQSKTHVVNAAGAWRHVETRGGIDGWLYEVDLEP